MKLNMRRYTEYKRRNKRDEKPKYKSRDVSNTNGGNTN